MDEETQMKTGDAGRKPVEGETGTERD